MFCRRCGTKIKAETKFCSNCGAKVIYEDVMEAQQGMFGLEDVPVAEKELALSGNGADDFPDMGKKENGYDESKKPSVLISQRFQKKDVLGKLSTVAAILGIVAALGLVIVACILIIKGIHWLIRLIFSSLVSMIIAAAVGYYMYHSGVAELITAHRYKKTSKELNLPEGMDNVGLLESLAGKFNYPFFKGVHYGETGECVIEGKYSMYPVKFQEGNAAELGYIVKEDEKRKRTVLLEAMAIRDYINKFFNPALPVDVAKDMKKLKLAEGQRKGVAIVAAIAPVLVITVLLVGYLFPGRLQNIVTPGMSVRNSYLSAYSSSVTIEEAFKNFFDDGKWTANNSGDYPEVIFTGICMYNDERADVRIVFKITGENFIVDSLDINGRRQSDIILYAVLSAVYDDL